jgi:D-arabinose 1-dehydrogenase-like Zn-dependent alcohol dehydrogenase
VRPRDPAKTLDQFDDVSSRENEAYERMMKGDVRYRFVIDIACLN